MSRYVFILMIVVGLLTACSLAQAQETLPSATPVAPSPAAAVPTQSRSLQPIPPQQTPTTLSPEICDSDAPTRYNVTAQIDYRTGVIDVTETILYTNLTGTSQNEIHLYVEPTRWTNAFVLNAIQAEDAELLYTLNYQRLTITLPRPLEINCSLQFTLDFRLNMPPLGGGVDAYKGYFSRTETQINLGYWLPMVAPFLDGEWIVHNSTLIGEQTILPTADWNVLINVLNAPETVTIAAPGEMTQPAENQWRFVAEDLRDFAASISDQFELHSVETETGVSVELYSIAGTPERAVDHALATAVQATAMFEDLFGDYPYERLLIIQGEFPDGMEFSGLVFVSNDWFVRYEGDPASYLTLITVHEVSHQWWYSAVGNDAAINPWLDEALATYSEYIYLEEYYPDLRDWWWEFRVNRLQPQGFVDGTVYEFGTIREYINAVYLRGVRMLHDLREDLGTEAFFQWLRDYAETASGQIASPETLFSLLTSEQMRLTADTRRQYLRGVGEHP
jgi:hypothetical protein